MNKAAAVLAVLGAVANPALAQQNQGEVSDQRATAMERCHQIADKQFGPSGVRDWRRYNSDMYDSCMATQGQPQ